MWFERDLPRLNVLLEILAEWMRVERHAQLRDSIGRLKWVIDFAACFLTIRDEQGALTRFAAGAIAASPIEPAEELEACARATEEVLRQGQMAAPASPTAVVLAIPLRAEEKLFGVLTFRARDGQPYLSQDLRFADAIADYFAAAWHRIATRDRQLHAESQSRQKDEFLALLGHELRNPLAPMVTALELMREGGSHPRQREILERQVRHLSRLLDDLMDISRVTRGKIQIDAKLVDVSEVIARSIEMTRPVLESARHPVTVAQDVSNIAAARPASSVGLAQNTQVFLARPS